LPLVFPALGFVDPRTGFGEGGVDHPARDGGDGVAAVSGLPSRS
jgi:hypothetical protein